MACVPCAFKDRAGVLLADMRVGARRSAPALCEPAFYCLPTTGGPSRSPPRSSRCFSPLPCPSSLLQRLGASREVGRKWRGGLERHAREACECPSQAGGAGSRPQETMGRGSPLRGHHVQELCTLAVLPKGLSRAAEFRGKASAPETNQSGKHRPGVLKAVSVVAALERD